MANKTKNKTPSPRKGLDESASTVAFTSSQFILYYK